jgi:hypothetical protein
VGLEQEYDMVCNRNSFLEGQTRRVESCRDHAVYQRENPLKAPIPRFPPNEDVRIMKSGSRFSSRFLNRRCALTPRGAVASFLDQLLRVPATCDSELALLAAIGESTPAFRTPRRPFGTMREVQSRRLRSMLPARTMYGRRVRQRTSPLLRAISSSKDSAGRSHSLAAKRCEHARRG